MHLLRVGMGRHLGHARLVRPACVTVCCGLETGVDKHGRDPANMLGHAAKKTKAGARARRRGAVGVEQVLYYHIMKIGVQTPPTLQLEERRAC